MITREQINEVFENKNPYRIRDVDHTSMAVMLLRNKIPYDICRQIISAAEHDKIYLCDIDKAAPYLSEDDLTVLADCNVCIDRQFDCFYLFV